MDYAGWPETHRITPQPQLQPPNTNPQPPDPYSSSHYPYYRPDHIPVPLTAVTHSSLEPHDLYADPGRIIPIGPDAYASLNSYQHTHFHIQGHAAAGSYVHHHQTLATGPSVYYSDPNSQNWAAKEAVRIYGAYRVGYGAGVSIPSSGTEQLAIANPNFTFRANNTPRHGNSAGKTYQKKMKTKTKTKTVQSVYCELCNIDCDTKDVLDKHKLGKKHKKNLEKLNKVTAPAQSAEGSKTLVIGPQEQPNTDKAVGGKKSRKKAAAHEEDLESKRRKVLEGGAAVEAVRTCAICNVVCNSETVFNYHLAGQKHAAMVKKQAGGTGMATAS